MAGEIQIGGTTFATESGGIVTVANVDSATNRQNLGLEIGVDVQQYDADTTKNDVANTFTANQIILVTDNTNAALRVTQLGTGNALVVEDSTNPDSTPFLVDANGAVCIGTTSPYASQSGLTIGNPSIDGTSDEAGLFVSADGFFYFSTSEPTGTRLTDTSPSAGTHNYIWFRYQSSVIGDIDTTDNDTIRYNTFTGGHWTQFEDGTQQNLPLGTVLSTVDDLLQWTEYEYTDKNGQTEKTTVAGFDPIGETKTIYIDEDGATAEGTALSHDTARRIAKCKVSDVAGDKCVYGVFAGHYKDGDSSVESLGLGIIRIGSGVTVQRGDLLESAGDGTARPQTGDFPDLFKAGTIAKVTSTTIVETYDDGSYTVPCTLHCG